MQKVDHTKNIIELRGVSFGYGAESEAVLDNITLAIHQGDYLGVIGPNGGGKTTLLKIMLGLLEPRQGEVTLFGVPVHEFKEWWKIGYVPQKAVNFDATFPATVEEIVMMGRYGKRGLLHPTTKEDRSRVLHALDEVNMREYKDRLIGDLSGGQQQRVFIARALVTQPEVVFLDEPTAGVDVATQEQFYKLLQTLNTKLDLTLVLISHDIGVISEQATELAWINRTLTYYKSPQEFLSRPDLKSISTLTNMLALFQYGFVVRGLEAGLIIAVIAPLIGMFLVLRRYSLIADTLSHVSLAGVAIGLLLGINPVITAIFAAVLSSAAIERLRLSKRVYGESALAIFLSGSLALAIVLISAGHGFSVDIFNYLFGSIVTVKNADIALIGGLGVVVIALLMAFYKELVYVTFDEEAAKVSGIPTRFINLLLIILAAFTVALAIPIIGVLLISALVVVPVVAALQLRRSFAQTILWAEAISIFSVVAGIIVSFYMNLSTGGTIVLITIAIFLLAFFFGKQR